MKLKNRIEVETIEGVNCWQEKDQFKNLYTRWDSSFIFNSFDARSSGFNSRLQKKLSCVRR
jgi:hypothetical protein